MRRRILGLVTAVVMLAAACSTAPGSRPRSGTEVKGPSALDDPRHPGFPEPLIDPDHLFSGGPPPDGIPPIDDPKFEPVAEVDWLDANEPVLSLTVADETRAYPLQVMAWHEIVNDNVGDVPVAVTFCPLCNSGVAFERRVEDRLLDFGTSGLLYVDNLVMYDRQTESLWPQLTGQASVGVLTGTQLEAIPMGIVGWKQFRESHPEALVLTRDTGFVRDYGSNPYVWRDDDPNGDLFADPPGGTDGRLPVKERIVGIMMNGRSVAVRRSHVIEQRVVELTVGGRDLVVWHRSGQASALDADRFDDGEEVGSVGVFRPLLDGRRLSFAVRAGRVIDEQTGSTWNVLGEATSGQLEGGRLPAVVHLDTFWFVWVAFRPRTRLVE